VSFAHVVEHMASALAFAQRERNEPTVPLDHFDCAQPLAHSYIETVKGRQDLEVQGMFRDVTPRDLGAPVRYAMLADLSDDNDDTWRGYACWAARQLTFAELRGSALPFVSAAHCRASMVGIDRRGTYAGSWRYCSWHPRERRWLTWGQGLPPLHDAFAQRMHLLAGGQFSARYLWHVDVGFLGAPRVSIPCQAHEARALFAARDVPEGRERRAALRHWVSEHYRHQPAPVYVRRHLRGALDFTWEHMECRVRPSLYDQEKPGAK
jgi:hypothetical protein